jgi:2-dehydro-3-deoxy-D-arabinonate dehydratase
MRVIRLLRGEAACFAIEEEPGVFTEVEARSALDCLAGRAERKRVTHRAVDPLGPLFEPGIHCVLPIDPPEVWCAGVTYERSREARVAEAVVKDVYSMVYDAPRPELFLKDTMWRRTVGPGERIGIREDSTWNVPEAEIGLVLGERGQIAGYTIGNDVSSRDIEGANPLYLAQAKVYAGACSLGPAVLASSAAPPVFEITLRIVDEWGDEVLTETASTGAMRRSFDELVGWLLRDNPVPPGSVLLTGTGIVPPDSFTLLPGHRVEITVPGIGTLANRVALAGELASAERSRR